MRYDNYANVYLLTNLNAISSGLLFDHNYGRYMNSRFCENVLAKSGGPEQERMMQRMLSKEKQLVSMSFTHCRGSHPQASPRLILIVCPMESEAVIVASNVFSENEKERESIEKECYNSGDFPVPQRSIIMDLSWNG